MATAARAALAAASSLSRSSSSAPAVRLIARRGLAGGGDHHGPQKVNFWEYPLSPSKWKDEHAVTFHRLKRLTIRDLTFKNSQQMHMAFTNCSRITSSRLKVMAPAKSPNTDGIHISASHSIVLEDSVVQIGKCRTKALDRSSCFTGFYHLLMHGNKAAEMTCELKKCRVLYELYHLLLHGNKAAEMTCEV